MVPGKPKSRGDLDPWIIGLIAFRAKAATFEGRK